MRVLVCGGRTYRNISLMQRVLTAVHKLEPITCLIEGGAKGADYLAKAWAVGHNVPVETYHAKWQEQGRSAGTRRNAKMLAEGKPDVVIAFGGNTGTNDMVRRARAAGVHIEEYERDNFSNK